MREMMRWVLMSVMMMVFTACGGGGAGGNMVVDQNNTLDQDSDGIIGKYDLSPSSTAKEIEKRIFVSGVFGDKKLDHYGVSGGILEVESQDFDKNIVILLQGVDTTDSYNLLPFSSNTDTLQVKLPAIVGDYIVRVYMNDTLTLASSVEILDTNIPIIYGVSYAGDNNFALVGDVLSIEGKNLANTENIYINNLKVTVASKSNTKVSFLVTDEMMSGSLILVQGEDKTNNVAVDIKRVVKGNVILPQGTAYQFSDLKISIGTQEYKIEDDGSFDAVVNNKKSTYVDVLMPKIKDIAGTLYLSSVVLGDMDTVTINTSSTASSILFRDMQMHTYKYATHQREHLDIIQQHMTKLIQNIEDGLKQDNSYLNSASVGYNEILEETKKTIYTRLYDKQKQKKHISVKLRKVIDYDAYDSVREYLFDKEGFRVRKLRDEDDGFDGKVSISNDTMLYASYRIISKSSMKITHQSANGMYGDDVLKPQNNSYFQYAASEKPIDLKYHSSSIQILTPKIPLSKKAAGQMEAKLFYMSVLDNVIFPHTVNMIAGKAGGEATKFLATVSFNTVIKAETNASFRAKLKEVQKAYEAIDSQTLLEYNADIEKIKKMNSENFKEFINNISSNPYNNFYESNKYFINTAIGAGKEMIPTDIKAVHKKFAEAVMMLAEIFIKELQTEALKSGGKKILKELTAGAVKRGILMTETGGAIILALESGAIVDDCLLLYDFISTADKVDFNVDFPFYVDSISPRGFKSEAKEKIVYIHGEGLDKRCSDFDFSFTELEFHCAEYKKAYMYLGEMGSEKVGSKTEIFYWKKNTYITTLNKEFVKDAKGEYWVSFEHEFYDTEIDDAFEQTIKFVGKDEPALLKPNIIGLRNNTAIVKETTTYVIDAENFEDIDVFAKLYPYKQKSKKVKCSIDFKDSLLTAICPVVKQSGRYTLGLEYTYKMRNRSAEIVEQTDSEDFSIYANGSVVECTNGQILINGVCEDKEPDEPIVDIPELTLTVIGKREVKDGEEVVLKAITNGSSVHFNVIGKYLKEITHTNKSITVLAKNSTDKVQINFINVVATDKNKNQKSVNKKIVILPKQTVDPTNQPPTVTLSAALPSDHVVRPIASDDKGIVRYEWSTVWSGDKSDQASPRSGTASTLGLTLPPLVVGESGSVNVTVTVYDAGGESATAIQTYHYGIEKTEAVQFISNNFTDGEVLPRGGITLLEWTLKNVGNVDLKDVKLTLTQTADALATTAIEPSTIALWKKGEEQIFKVDLIVPNTITAGTHRQQWNLYHDTNKPLPYAGSVTAAPIYFVFKTINPNALIGRLITDKKLVTPSEAVTSLLEVTSGNAPYKVEIDWGDGREETLEDVAKNTDEGMTTSLTHSYTSEGSYPITVKVTDNADKSATLTDTITVKSSATETSWTADVHDIDTDERASDISILVDTVVYNGENYGEYHTNWSPSKQADSTEYFVKYRLPVPSKLLMLNQKLRVTVAGLSSDIEGYDREINFRTSDSKEYTASIRHKDHEDTLADGTSIKGGYFTTKDIKTGSIVKEEAEFLNSEYIPLDGVYAMSTTPSSTLNVYTYENSDYTNLFPKTVNLSDNWLTELDVTFKGNGLIRLITLEYDVDGDGVFGSDEKLVLSTVDKKVDWSVFGVEPSSTKVKKTGQTKSYDEDGNETTDGSVKDDGHYQKGVAPHYSRDDATDIVTDHITGLEWQDDVNITKQWLMDDNYDICEDNNSRSECYDTSGDTATTYCEELDLGDYTDWRLPTSKELEGIVDYGKYDPSIDTTSFHNVVSSDYWSSTTNEYYHEYAWGVYFGNGTVYRDAKDNNLYVRCVRDGQ